ncbi:hypothetical protein, partial [Halomonas sp. 3D7M]|uniref:hypothetical protein n=1 Tax=Halomonas sp. 3D7M TaxID=2742617 RepID=UPI0021F808D6
AFGSRGQAAFVCNRDKQLERKKIKAAQLGKLLKSNLTMLAHTFASHETFVTHCLIVAPKRLTHAGRQQY